MPGLETAIKMLPSTRFEITNHCRERYAERVLEWKIKVRNEVKKIPKPPSGIFDPVVRQVLDPIIRKDFLGARAATPAEKKQILCSWTTPTGKFHDSNVVLINPHTKTMFVCELKPNQVGVFVGRTCFNTHNANHQN